MTKNILLDIGQDLNIIGDEISKGSMICANINAELEELDLFGKEKTTMKYLDININELIGFSNKIEYYTNELIEAKKKIQKELQTIQKYIESYQNHVY